MTDPWQTLSQSLADLERTDPAVAESAKRFDEMVDRAAFDTVTRRDLARRALNAEAAVSRVRELHQRAPVDEDSWCSDCGDYWPCRTLRALDGEGD